MTTQTDAPHEVLALDPGEVQTNGSNTRGKIGKADVADLVASIEAQGQLVPIIVRMVEYDADDEGIKRTFEVVAGHRRLEACRILNRKVLAITIEATDAEALAALLAENEVRTQPDPFRESEAVQRLQDLGWDQQTVAAALGKTPRWVAQRVRLRTLTPKARKALEKRGWPVTWIEQYARLSPEAQDAFLKETENVYASGDLDRLFERVIQTLGNAPWDLEDDTLDPKAGPCTTCPKTSSSTPGLFDVGDETNPKKARCLDLTCWTRKKMAFVVRGVARIREKHPECDTILVEDGAGGTPIPEGEKKVLRSWEAVPCKEGTKGAVPVVGVGKRGTAKLMWVKPGPAGSATAKPKKEKAPKDLPPAAKLKAAKERIEVRRQAFVVDLVRGLFDRDDENVPKAPNPSVVAGLVACYAVDGPRTVWKGEVETAKSGVLFDLAHGRALPAWGPWAEQVWPRLARAIRTALTYGHQGTIPAAYEEAVVIGSCIGLTRAELDAQAMMEIPNPKGWASLERAAQDAGKEGKGKKARSK